MKEKRKKEFEFPTEANIQGDVGVQVKLNHSVKTEDKFVGDSVDEHKDLEAGNEYIAEKEIGQTFHNS
ncbi:hypothetical protein DCC39_12335 [Pueribacillus theae]|uniref:DUF4025 domain-containing protein n=1 Tax=Pueribacillus theae TaxID=2171751 RepID=A0A2U1JX04_9BACI|nr:hypothetical protein [Pueribacillus theae]PWA09746.1 hypothetical protein DCC39_12335 [Pueribacillus theae]